MRAFSEYNPFVTAIYFLCVAGIVMFSMNPLLLLTSLLGALLLFFMQNGRKQSRSHIAYLILFLAMALVNPIFSHKGQTILFVVNDSPITAEAILYGVFAATMVTSVLYWFRSFTQIMTSDRLLYLFGKLSPKLALILSMALRYVPLFSRQAKKVNQAQTGIGLYKEDNIIDRMRGHLRIFSVMVTWALENGIVTADSMTARGYGIGKRSHFSIFRFRAADIILLSWVILLTGITYISLSMGALDFSYYPAVEASEPSIIGSIGYLAYAMLALLPTIIEAEEKIKWKYLQSKI